ncbi:extracellular solute-binding protein [Calidifontibacter sp. DB0510]|uniref:Extracellular solute-binding protein n=1 Tax=Metallococcus carri TaxID=1656884 RepID=A0A967B2X9_9MICO|nr:extracellular solute-binding protein [Metallococcus carri]NHN54672.1 extracellular solute-binding protein [Metallococcus carri]NOP37017.1 extracellular solute-binding protein [Calidifontibacter sp. DB2511S]
MSRNVFRTGTVIAAVSCLGLAACAPGSSGGSSASKSNASAPAQTDPAKLGKVTLTVWDQEVRGGQAKQITQLNAAFQKKYPNITIKRVPRSFDDLGKTIKLALSGDNPPDVAEVNNGRGDMGAFVKAGQLLDLGKYAKAYGWDERYPQSVRQYSSYSPDGKTFGTGNLYGLPQVGEVVDLYVNTEHLQQAGLAMPTTWEQLVAAMKTLKAKRPGEAPMVLGDLDKWPAIHVFGPTQAQFVAPDDIRKLAFGQKGANWKTPGNQQAAQTLVDWMKAGYLDAKTIGTGYDNANKAFSQGKGTFLMAGTWLAADPMPALGSKVRFILPPPSKAAGGKEVSTGGTGIPWAISSKTKHPDAAAAYINFITSPEAMKVLASTGNVPVANTSEQTAATPLDKDVLTAFGKVVEANGLVPYLDYATPTMADTLGAALQDLLAGRKTPAQFLDTLQQDYSGFVAKNG